MKMRRAVLASFATLLAFASVVSVAAAEPAATNTRPRSKANKEASDRYLTGVRALQKDKLAQASERFTKAAEALTGAERQLARCPQPATDAAKLTKWLAGIKGEVGLMKTIAVKFDAGNKSKGSSLAVKLTHNANVANNLVIAFQFNYCKIDPSRFT
jgi:hypothetical protein